MVSPLHTFWSLQAAPPSAQVINVFPTGTWVATAVPTTGSDERPRSSNRLISRIEAESPEWRWTIRDRT